MADIKADLIQAGVDAANKLTARGVFMTAIAGFVGIGLYNLYENREHAFTAIASSPPMIAALCGAMLLLGVIWVFAILAGRVERTFMERLAERDKRIEELRKDLEDCRSECRAGIMTAIHSIAEKIDGKID